MENEKGPRFNIDLYARKLLSAEFLGNLLYHLYFLCSDHFSSLKFLNFSTFFYSWNVSSVSLFSLSDNKYSWPMCAIFCSFCLIFYSLERSAINVNDLKRSSQQNSCYCCCCPNFGSSFFLLFSCDQKSKCYLFKMFMLGLYCG